MAGIFPDGGVSASSALGADPTILPTDLTLCEGGALFYPTNRCQTRFDPKAQNALISEAINLVKKAGLDYDCSKSDNLARAVEKLSNEAVFKCLTQDFPALANACAIERLVLQTDTSGCERIARYSEDLARIGHADNASVWGLAYPSTVHPLPGQQTVGTDIYDLVQLGADMTAGTVNGSVLYGPGQQNVLGLMDLNLACQSRVRFVYDQQMAFEPQQNGGNGTRSVCIIQVDGVLIPTSQGTPLNFGLMSNFQASYHGELTVLIGPGPHQIRFTLVAVDSQIARVVVAGNPNATGGAWTAEVGF